MGRILNLFDATHNNNGPVLTKERVDGCKEAGEVQREMKEKAETQKRSGNLKREKMPIKTLIAQEMLKSADASSHPPNLIARLMGLDELPKDSSQKKVTEKHQAKSKQPWKKLQPSGSVSTPRDVIEKSKASENKNDHSLKPPNLALAQNSESAVHPPRNKTKARLQNDNRISKSKSNSEGAELRNLKTSFLEDKVHGKEGKNDLNMALVRQKFLDAKHLASDERLIRSREFVEAVEFLQSNKDAFLKFLEEPNSMFSESSQRRSHDSKAKEITVLRSCTSKKSDKLKDEKANAAFCHGPRTSESHLRKLVGLEGYVNRGQLKEVRQAPPTKPISKLSIKEQFKQYETINSESCGNNPSTSFPTRIVVLKPSPSKAQKPNLNSSQPVSPQSLANKSNFEMPSRSDDYLQQVRQRLEIELGKSKREKAPSPMELSANDTQNARDIVKHIATQVRKSISKDSLPDKPKEEQSIFSNESSSEYKDACSEILSPSDATTIGSGFSSLSHDFTRFIDCAESTVNKEAKKRLLERWKSTHGTEENHHKQCSFSTLGEMLSFSARKKEDRSPSHSVKVSNSVESPGSRSKKALSQEGIVEWESSLESKNSDAALQRCRSVPGSAASYDKEAPETSCRASVSDSSSAYVVVDGRRNNGSGAENVKAKKEKSLFKGKVSSLKGSFLLLGKHTNAKKVTHQKPPSDQNVSHKELSTDQMQKKTSKISAKEPVTSSKEERYLPNPESKAIDAGERATKHPVCDDIGTAESRRYSSILQPKKMKNEFKLDIASAESPSPSSPVGKTPILDPIFSDCNSQNCEHPSPVSVLDTLLEEEFSAPPRDFKEISTNLQDLRMRLNLLKFDTSDGALSTSSEISYGNSLPMNGFESEADSARGTSCASPSDADLLYTPKSFLSSTENCSFDSFNIDGILCSEEHQPNLLYIKNILTEAGFTGDINAIFARWYLPSSPLDPSLFQKLEVYYKDIMQYRAGECKLNSDTSLRDQQEKAECHLIFDSVNELLLSILGGAFNCRPWQRTTRKRVQAIPSGKQLLEEIWAKVSSNLYPQSESNQTLQGLMVNDLTRENVWLNLGDNEESIAQDIERTMVDDLLDEVIEDLVS